MPAKKILPMPTPVHVWSDRLEREAQAQLEKLSTMPFLHHHVAVMPDVHAGRGSTVGTVIATKGAIIPAAVGVDIGCGMIAAKTNLSSTHLEGKLPRLRSQIESYIPVGFNQNKTVQNHLPELDLWDTWEELTPKVSDDDRLQKKALAQCGSLGGGNHFIEVCLDENDQIWIMLHSGSRNIGKVLADVHIGEARGEMKQALAHLPDRDLAHFTQGTEAFKAYIHDLQWAQRYAYQNREEMMRRIIDLFQEEMGESFQIRHKVNCHHNYATQEIHYGEKVWVTRKGAVSAKKDEWGIIPGSMGTKSYIVKGKGNLESFQSCSHGAGRRMSRTQAKKTFTRKDLEEQTKGVECRKDKGVLDEIPAAYKDIDEVMANQVDLVEVQATLKQVLCVKG